MGIPQESVDNPLLFKQGLKEYRAYEKAFSKDNIPARPRPGDLPYIKYEKYLQALREVRRDQSAYLKDAISTDSASPREDYLEKTKFSPHLADKVLFQINTFLERGKLPKFSDEQRQIAISSPQNFAEAVNSALDKKPDIFYENIKDLTHVVTPDKAREIIFKLGSKDYHFLAHYSKIKHFLSPDEQKRLLTPYIEKPEYAWLLTGLFRDSDATKLFSPEQVKQAVEFGFKEDHDDMNKGDINFYLKEGVLQPADVQNIILERIKNFRKISDIDSLLLKPHGSTSVEEIRKQVEGIRQQLITSYTQDASSWNLETLMPFSQFLNAEEKAQIINSIMGRDPIGAISHISMMEALVPPEILRPSLQQLIDEKLKEVNETAVYELCMSTTLNTEDKESLLEKLDRVGKSELFLKHLGEIQEEFSDEKRKELINRIIVSASPKALATNFDGWQNVVSDEQLYGALDKIQTDYEALSTIIGQIYRWGAKVDQEYTINFLKKYQSTHGADILSDIGQILKFIPEVDRAAFVSDAIKSNPFAAVYNIQESESVRDNLAQIGFNMTPEQVIEMAGQDESRLSFAPKTLRELLKQYSPDKSFEEQKAVILEAFLLYKSINMIQFNGLAESLHNVQTASNIPMNKEKELISTFSCFSLLKDSNREQFSQIESFGSSIEESQQILFNQLSKLLGTERQFSPEQVSRFFGTMESPAPFMIYLLQYKDSPTHRNLLTQIFNSITEGKFSEWKYGPNTEQNLEQLKQAGLIPEKLTYEQYTLWRTDGQTTLFESLATDTQTTANAIRDYLEGNLNHLEIRGVLDHLMSNYPDQDLVVGLQQDLASLGQQLAITNRELASSKKQTGSDPKHISELEQAKVDLEKRRSNLIRARKIIRLINIKPNEVAAGYFLEGKDSKQRGDSIDKVLNELKDESADENSFAYDEVKNMLDSFRSSSDEKQNLICTDSSDPKIWLEIGEKPVASCQSYDHGGFNECLVAYTDPNTKILVLRNEKGSVIARSIFRLLETSSGEPALHIERIYSASTSKGILRSMFSRSYQKAQEMGLPLLISEKSQDEEGSEKEAQLAEGYMLNTVNYSLNSKASRAPKVYVDSAGGVSYDGQYEMKDLVEVQKKAA